MTFQTLEFSYTSFQELIRKVKARGYSFHRFDAYQPTGKPFFLRHDVDLSPISALRMGQIAKDEQVVSNFFFQLNAETYNCFSEEVLAILSALRDMGHCVGLHIDQGLLTMDEAKVAKTLDWFDECVVPIDRVVSFHRPTPEVLGKSFSSFISAYSDRFFKEGQYFSDSRRSTGFAPALAHALDLEREPLQLLLHPEWWAEYGACEEGFLNAIRARRVGELDRYLLKTCRKVFSEVIPNEDRTFGL